jgi:hypothetical protein
VRARDGKSALDQCASGFVNGDPCRGEILTRGKDLVRKTRPEHRTEHQRLTGRIGNGQSAADPCGNEEAGAAGTAAGPERSTLETIVSRPLDPDKLERCNAATRAFNALTAAEQKAFSVAVAPAALNGAGWPAYAVTAFREAGMPVPASYARTVEDIDLVERKLLMVRIWRSLSEEDQKAFLRRCVPSDMLEAFRDGLPYTDDADQDEARASCDAAFG